MKKARRSEPLLNFVDWARYEVCPGCLVALIQRYRISGRFAALVARHRLSIPFMLKSLCFCFKRRPVVSVSNYVRCAMMIFVRLVQKENRSNYHVVTLPFAMQYRQYRTLSGLMFMSAAP